MATFKRLHAEIARLKECYFAENARARNAESELSRLQGENERLMDKSFRLTGELLALRSKVTRVEQECRTEAEKWEKAEHGFAMDNKLDATERSFARRETYYKVADALASLVNEIEAPETSPKPSLGDF